MAMTIALGGPYCNNCGRTSHCGLHLMEEFYDVWDKHLGQIEVCKSCRCAMCEKQDNLEMDINDS